MLIPLAGFYLFGQKTDKKNLQDKKTKIEQEIKQTNQQLEETKKTKQSNLRQLQLIDRKIGQREDLITEIGSELNVLDGKVTNLGDTILRLNQDLQQLKDEYATLICATYKNRNQYNSLVFLFSAKDFNQAFKRMQYLKQYTEYRQSQVDQIINTQQELDLSKHKLESEKETKLTLLHKQEEEKQRLTKEKSEKDKTIKSLTSKEKLLVRQLQNKEIARQKLQKEIQIIVNEEIKKAKAEKSRLAKAKATPAATTKPDAKPVKTTQPVPEAKEVAAEEESNRMSSNDAEIALSNDFEKNRGKLPFPAENGRITATFGEYEHPDFRGVKLKNNGIDITTSPNARAQAIFDGVVSSVIAIAGMHNVVIVRHGDFLTVYSNLERVTVSKGEKIKTRQTLGTIAADETQKSILHFEVWKGTHVMNPALWIKK